MSGQPKTLRRLVEELKKLPGVGPKTAQRLAFHIMSLENEEAEKLANAILAVKQNLGVCKRCFNLAEEEYCSICLNDSREQDIVCIVEEAGDVFAIEKSGGFKGVYHVLQGSLSPLEGIGPEELKIKEFLERLETEKSKEVIIATNSTMEGEATAMYLKRRLKSYPVKITRIAYGLPMGGELEFIDDVTIAKALEGRRDF